MTAHNFRWRKLVDITWWYNTPDRYAVITPWNGRYFWCIRRWDNRKICDGKNRTLIQAKKAVIQALKTKGKT